MARQRFVADAALGGTATHPIRQTGVEARRMTTMCGSRRRASRKVENSADVLCMF
jgi:hypothetical protein